ncbi:MULTISPECIES: fumarate reductase subunit FrdD [Halomonadaceae]|uniref:fumarate reductase subunit FrdD n=1 Tax=Halomonadaceae TaxID=28256 RepID=UPI0015980241|nr:MULTISPECIES: fumarate reductase subunit FrdD [Halomonas]QJQ96366.1 fumarate reductase subunit D [Halomonas sp. PA5]
MNKQPFKGGKAIDEPLWWAMFSAGGVCFAIFVPAAILFIALLIPSGLLSPDALSYARAQSLTFSLPGLIFIGAVVCLPLFHAAHRIRHGMHDLKLGNDHVNKRLMYGGAALLSAVALIGFAFGVL